MMDVICSSEMSVNFHRTTWHYIPQRQNWPHVLLWKHRIQRNMVWYPSIIQESKPVLNKGLMYNWTAWISWWTHTQNFTFNNYQREGKAKMAQHNIQKKCDLYAIQDLMIINWTAFKWVSWHNLLSGNIILLWLYKKYITLSIFFIVTSIYCNLHIYT